MSSMSSKRLVQSRGSEYDLLSRFDASLSNVDPSMTQKTLDRLKREFKERSIPKNKDSLLLENQRESNQRFSKQKNRNPEKQEKKQEKQPPHRLKFFSENEKVSKFEPQTATRKRTPSCDQRAKSLSRMKREATKNSKEEAKASESEPDSPKSKSNSTLVLSRQSRPSSSCSNSNSMAGFATARSDFIQRRLRESVKSVDDACVVANRLGSLMTRLHFNHKGDGENPNAHVTRIANLTNQLEKLASSMKK